MAAQPVTGIEESPNSSSHGAAPFMSLAKKQRPDGPALWTFQVNEAAHRFYERPGLIEIERTDGLRNDEREPDVRYLWQPPPAR